MKAAEGTPIAEDLQKRYEHLLAVRNSQPTFQHFPATLNFEAGLIERLSAAEERERVLRGALRECRTVLVTDNEYPEDSGSVLAIDAALATPAPEQPSEQNGGR